MFKLIIYQPNTDGLSIQFDELSKEELIKLLVHCKKEKSHKYFFIIFKNNIKVFDYSIIWDKENKANTIQEAMDKAEMVEILEEVRNTVYNEIRHEIKKRT